jgi:hypothetical protein
MYFSYVNRLDAYKHLLKKEWTQINLVNLN